MQMQVQGYASHVITALVPEDFVQITGNPLVLHCCEAFAKINTGW